MKKILLIIISVLWLWIAFWNTVCESDPNSLDWLYWNWNNFELINSGNVDYSSKKSFAYYAPWLVPEFNYQDTNYDKIDIFLHAFVWPGVKWDLINFNNFVNTWFIDLAHSKWKKVLLSVWGYWNSYNFTSVLSNDNLRQHFMSGLINYMDKYGYDWLDIDWEFPHDQDDWFWYLIFIKELRKELWDKILSVALPLSVKSYNIDLCRMERYVDYIFVMSYDVESGWAGYAWHNSPLFQNDKMPRKVWIDSYLKINYYPFVENRSKIILWLPLYGRHFEVNNLYDNKYISTVVKYKDLPENWCKKIFDFQSRVPYLKCENAIISYDDLKSFYFKRQYLLNNWLGGYYYWALGQDDNYLVDNFSLTWDMTQYLLNISWFQLDTWVLTSIISWYNISTWFAKTIDSFFIRLYKTKDKDYISKRFNSVYEGLITLLNMEKYNRYRSYFEYIVLRIVNEKLKLGIKN